MKLGLIGMANAGKTTLFNALTGLNFETGYFHKNEPNIAVTEVIDERITTLSEIYQPKKTTYSAIEILDFPAEEEEKRKQFNAPQLKILDAFAVVLRNFNDEIINQTLGTPDPLRDLQETELEMVLSDLQLAEKRLEKVKLSFKRGIKTAEIQFEEKVLGKVIEALQQEIPLRKLDLMPDEEKTIRGFQLLTLKPMMVLLNSDDSNYGENEDLLNAIRQLGFLAVEIAGKFEMELHALEDDDRNLFMEEMKIESSAKDLIIQLAYNLLGYISFFTAGKQEVRAWTITKGSIAHEAAGVIHSDLQRGFIRAECFHYDELIEFGSEKALKDKGKIRLEGKNYLVKDGDLLLIRFNV